MRIRIPCIGAMLVCAACLLTEEAAGWVHVARAGENLDELSSRYYGSRDISIAIRAANGFMHPDDGRLLQGERVELPEMIYHEVKDDEEWDQLADRYLGSPKRGRFLAELNGLSPDENPAPGKIVKIPYQLLYVLAPDETLKSIARIFLQGKHSVKWLKEYNFKKKKKWGRGDPLLVPLMNVEFTQKEKERIEGLRGGGAPSAEDQQVQVDAVAQMTKLRESFEQGKYVLIVATAHRLLGTGKLTVPQQIGVYKYLAFAYVAFGDMAQARETFRHALVLQPGMELSPITTSPKILKAFRDAKKGIVSPGGTK